MRTYIVYCLVWCHYQGGKGRGNATDAPFIKKNCASIRCCCCFTVVFFAQKRLRKSFRFQLTTKYLPAAYIFHAWTKKKKQLKLMANVTCYRLLYSWQGRVAASGRFASRWRNRVETVSRTTSADVPPRICLNLNFEGLLLLLLPTSKIPII